MPTDELDGEEDAVDIGRRLAGPSKEAMDKFAKHGETLPVIGGIDADRTDLEADSADKRGAVMTNAHFRLMLNLLAFKRSEEENSESIIFSKALLIALIIQLPSKSGPSPLMSCLRPCKRPSELSSHTSPTRPSCL